METKICKRCDAEKPLELFKQDKRYASGLSSYCKSCHQEYTVAWQRRNHDRVNDVRRARYEKKKAEINKRRTDNYAPDKVRWQRIKYLYRIEREAYEAMMDAQGHKCAICGVPQSEVSRPFSVDHDHKCCKSPKTCGSCARGLLCNSCNTALHALEAKEGWAHSAMEYLERHKK